MLKDFNDIRNDVLVQSNISTTVAFITETILNDWINKSHTWAAAFYKWPFTEGRVSTTFASLVTQEDGYLRGEFPENWKSDSIRLLTIDGKEVKKLNIYSFRKFLEDNSGSDDRIYSDFGRSYFVNPNIDVSGTVTVWGQYTPAEIDVTDLTANTIFSNNEEEGNEAIVEEVLSFVKKRQQKTTESVAHHQKAVEILNGIWKRIQDEQFQYQQQGDDGMFERIDFIRGVTRNDAFKRDVWY